MRVVQVLDIHIMDYTGSLSKGINPYSSFDKLPCRF